MFRFLLVSCLLALSWGASIPTKGKKPLRGLAPNFPSVKIVGGGNATIESAPYQVALEKAGGEQFCGGVVLTETAILTSAYCLYEREPEDVVVRYGTNLRGSGGTVVEVNEFIRHSKYELITHDYDAAIVTVKTPLTFNGQTQPAKLAENEPAPSSGVRITGWGRLAEHQSYATVLQSVFVPILNHTVCVDAYEHFEVITDRMICGGYFLKDACEGDKGGPVIYDGTLVAIVSWAYGCAREEYPGVYTNIVNEEIRTFIRENAGV